MEPLLRRRAGRGSIQELESPARVCDRAEERSRGNDDPRCDRLRGWLRISRLDRQRTLHSLANAKHIRRTAGKSIGYAAMTSVCDARMLAHFVSDVRTGDKKGDTA